jgi:hypothetical protein
MNCETAFPDTQEAPVKHANTPCLKQKQVSASALKRNFSALSKH